MNCRIKFYIINIKILSWEIMIEVFIKQRDVNHNILQQEVLLMKEVEKKKPVPVIPQGVWEGSHTDKEEKEDSHYQNMITDLQGNGYAKKEENKEK